MRPEHDLHMHTYISACCNDKENHRPGQILALAQEMGVKLIGFADHVWMNPEVTPSGWYRPQDERQISRLRQDLSVIQTGVRNLVGCEDDMLAQGQLSITQEFARGLDFVLLSGSHLHMHDLVAQPRSYAGRDLAEHLLAMFRAALTSGLATSIAHPLLPCGHLESFDAAVETMSDGELADAFGLAVEEGVALEVTTGFIPAESAQFSMETPIRFLSGARTAGCRFTFGTDAHAPMAQRRLPELAQLAENAGITDHDLLPLVRTI